jgi:hypothetical protein
MAVDISTWKCNDRVWLRGDVTQLQAIAMATPLELAARLGLAPERMVRGYWICVMDYEPDDEKFMRRFTRDFIYAGTTMRSGARMGVPAATEKKDKLREHSHDVIMKSYGKDGYDRAKLADLQRITSKGHSRLVNVVTFVRHIKHMSPATQYPVGGPHLQWTLTNTKPLTCAALIDGQGIAHFAGQSLPISPGSPQTNFFKLERYLEQL